MLHGFMSVLSGESRTTDGCRASGGCCPNDLRVDKSIGAKTELKGEKSKKIKKRTLNLQIKGIHYIIYIWRIDNER